MRGIAENLTAPAVRRSTGMASLEKGPARSSAHQVRAAEPQTGGAACPLASGRAEGQEMRASEIATLVETLLQQVLEQATARLELSTARTHEPHAPEPLLSTNGLHSQAASDGLESPSRTRSKKTRDSEEGFAYREPSTSFPTPNRSTDLSTSWLLRLFRSDFFDAWMAVTYLYRYRLVRGVFDYICNELYSLDMEDVELYLPQLCNLLVFHARETSALEKFIMDKCAESMHFALQVYWFLQAASEDTRHRSMLKRCQLLRTRCETAAVNGYASTMLVGSPPATVELLGYDFTPVRLEDASCTRRATRRQANDGANTSASLFAMQDGMNQNAMHPHSGGSRRSSRHRRVHSLDLRAKQRTSRRSSLDTRTETSWPAETERLQHESDDAQSEGTAASADAFNESHDEAAGWPWTDVRALAESAIGMAADRLCRSAPHSPTAMPASRETSPRSLPQGSPNSQWPPSALEHTRLLAAKQERFDYFNDMLYFFRSLVRISLDLRAISPSKRERILRSRLEDLSELIYRRIAGFEGRPSRLGAQDIEVSAAMVAPRCPRAALRSIHLPLSRSNESVLRLLRIASIECVILSSKDRVPFMVYAEVLETNMKCSDRNIFCQHLASEDRLREMEALLYTASPARAILPDEKSFAPVEIVRLEEIAPHTSDSQEEHASACRTESHAHDATQTSDADDEECTPEDNAAQHSPNRPPVYAVPSRLLPRYAHRLASADLGTGLGGNGSASLTITSYSDLVGASGAHLQRARSLSSGTLRRLQHTTHPDTEAAVASDSCLATETNTVNNNQRHPGTDPEAATAARASSGPNTHRVDLQELQRKLVREAIAEKMLEKYGASRHRTSDTHTASAGNRPTIRASGFMHAAAHVPRGVNFREQMKAPLDEASERRAREATLLSVYGEMWAWKEARVRLASPFGHLPTWRLASFIVKAGDDLRQEQLAVQLIEQMLRIFEEESLPLWLRPFTIVCLGNNAGLVETIPDAVSVHALKKRTPNFISLREYFERAYGAPPSPALAKAVRNFTESMAGYSLVTYLFQVRDRHNGNIMLAASGHVIHIDFGFMLGNSPGSIRFEAAPFKLSPEYLQVMGDVQSETFCYFRELFVSGFLACRKHHEKLTTLIEIMLEGTRLPCMAGGMAVVDGLRQRLMLSLPERECIRAVLDLIDESIDNWRTRQYDRFQFYSNGIL